MKKKSPVLLAIMILAILFNSFSVFAANKGDVQPSYTYTKIATDTYKINSGEALSGYLFVGTKKCLVVGIDKAISSIGKNKYVSNKKIIYTDTNVSSAAKYDLGNRRIKAVDLSGAESLLGIKFPVDKVKLSNTVGYIDEGNKLVITNESIGNGKATVSGDKNKLMDFGRSYYNMLNFQSSVHKVAKLTASLKNPVIYDGKGNKIGAAYVNDLQVLVDKVMNFDASLIYDFDTTKTGSNYIAKYNTATLEIHDGTYGFLGYDLIGTSIISSTYVNTNFFTVNYKNQFYMIKDTDVQTAYIFMNDKEAFMIDTGMYNSVGFANRVKNLIGDRKLSVYITHGHGDHFINLVNIPTDMIQAVYIPEKETYFTFGAADGGYNFDADVKGRLKDKVHYVKDGDILKAAGKEFQVIVVPGHTPYGTSLLDITDRHLFSGDTLGTQAYFGGTSFNASTLDAWIKSMKHLSDTVGLGTSQCKIDDIFMMHINAPVTKDYITWMSTIMNALKEKKDVILTVPGAAKGSSIVMMENGKFMNQKQADELNKNDCYESDLYKYCSITYSAN